MAGNLEGHLTVLIIIEMVIIKLLAQILPFVIIAERMAIEQWPSPQKKRFQFEVVWFWVAGQGFYNIQIPEEKGEPQLKTFPDIMSVREGLASKAIIDTELKHLFRGKSGWTIQQLGDNGFVLHFRSKELRYNLEMCKSVCRLLTWRKKLRVCWKLLG
jgi:hypothetical protein